MGTESGRTESERSFSRFSIGVKTVGSQPSPEMVQQLIKEADALGDRYEERLNNQKAIIDRQKERTLRLEGELAKARAEIAELEEEIKGLKG